ncbi:DUF2382 domain-containing protein [Allorhizocola rhizosphaerae]|uniref:DUF2382 domain-containing protein n=1 Tax=Allorhizocola rhizosphaerae TaxID=1872709 RepID=UPI000E3E88EE|nr:PRC and DUF2382 domain-containing protein [Allorhizocola rhizosphaerae]
MISRDQVQMLSGAKVIDRTGDKVGSVGQIYVDDQTGQPAWVAVRTGMFGMTESLAPLDRDATLSEGTLRISASKQQVKDAPQIEPESGHLSEWSAAELYRYYNMPYSSRLGDTGDRRQQQAANLRRSETTAQRDTAAQSMADKGKNLNLTRYEEQLRVGKEQVETGHVRLRKHVVTEDVNVRVPISHEEVRVERTPVKGTARATQHEFADESVDMTLHAERPVVSKESVPVEEVHLTKETRTEEQPVRGTVRKERIEVEEGTETATDRERRYRQ